MAKSKEHILARRLRGRGKSIKNIARLLGVSKSSVSVWCRDIVLTINQIDNLHSQSVIGGYKGRLKGARLQREKREFKIRNYEKLGVKNIGSLGSRDLLLLGLGLYLGEGNKSGNKFQFTNSNPDIIKLIILWLKKMFGIKKKDFVFHVMINQAHRSRDEKLKKYWARITNSGMSYFNKTVFIKAKNKKIYQNFNNHFGTLVVRVKKSSDLQYRILGLCFGVVEKSKLMKMPA